jgi:protein-S-isoprenylcysteine O-methyltransferase Ste14
MYLALLLLLIAWAIYLSNLAAFAAIPFFVAYMNRFQIIPEEKTLTSLFGSEYEAYRKRVRRWL